MITENVSLPYKCSRKSNILPLHYPFILRSTKDTSPLSSSRGLMPRRPQWPVRCRLSLIPFAYSVWSFNIPRLRIASHVFPRCIHRKRENASGKCRSGLERVSDSTEHKEPREIGRVREGEAEGKEAGTKHSSRIKQTDSGRGFESIRIHLAQVLATVKNRSYLFPGRPARPMKATRYFVPRNEAASEGWIQ